MVRMCLNLGYARLTYISSAVSYDFSLLQVFHGLPRRQGRRKDQEMKFDRLHIVNNCSGYHCDNNFS